MIQGCCLVRLFQSCFKPVYLILAIWYSFQNYDYMQKKFPFVPVVRLIILFICNASVNANLKDPYSIWDDFFMSYSPTFDRLDYCPYIQTITFIFSKSAPTFSGRVSVSKICTSGDLHHTIQGPASHHPRTCITPSRPASGHPGTCITPSKDLQAMRHKLFYHNCSGWIKKEAGTKSIQSAQSVESSSILMNFFILSTPSL